MKLSWKYQRGYKVFEKQVNYWFYYLNNTKMTTTKLATVDDKVLNDYLESLWIAKTLPVEQKKMFLQIAKANNLNPFKKEVYAIPYKGKDGKTTLSIITWYQTYIARANASWNLDWWKAETIRDDKWNIVWAKVIIHRKDWSQPFVWEISRKDFDKWTASWKTMPDFMTKKVAIAQAFRLAFPDELGGMPYTQEEMEGVQPVQQEAVIVEEPKITKEQAEQAVEDLQNFANMSEEGKLEKAKENLDKVEPVKDPEAVTDAQIRKIHAVIADIKKINPEKNNNYYKEQMKATYQVESTKDLKKRQASKFIEYLLKELETEKNLQEVANEDEIPF